MRKLTLEIVHEFSILNQVYLLGKNIVNFGSEKYSEIRQMGRDSAPYFKAGIQVFAIWYGIMIFENFVPNIKKKSCHHSEII